jgi:hypothetical protein
MSSLLSKGDHDTVGNAFEETSSEIIGKSWYFPFNKGSPQVVTMPFFCKQRFNAVGRWEQGDEKLLGFTTNWYVPTKK